MLRTAVQQIILYLYSFNWIHKNFPAWEAQYFEYVNVIAI